MQIHLTQQLYSTQFLAVIQRIFHRSIWTNKSSFDLKNIHKHFYIYIYWSSSEWINQGLIIFFRRRKIVWAAAVNTIDLTRSSRHLIYELADRQSMVELSLSKGANLSVAASDDGCTHGPFSILQQKRWAKWMYSSSLSFGGIPFFVLSFRIKSFILHIQGYMYTHSRMNEKVQNIWLSFTQNWKSNDRFIVPGNVEVLSLLLQNGADVNAKNMMSQTPLDYAIQFGKFWYSQLRSNSKLHFII